MTDGLYRFDQFELDARAYELRRNGQLVHLERIPFELLLLLVERHGELVTREEILERIWGKNLFLDATNAVNTAVRKLRRALGDSLNAPRFVTTIQTKGYRFIAKVNQSMPPEPDTQNRPDGSLQNRASIEANVVAEPTEFNGATSSLTSFVGRHDELRLLSNCWNQVLRGLGQMVLIVSEAGIGKSRLALHFRQQSGSSIRVWIYARAKPFFQNTPFSLVSELLRCLLQQLNNCNNCNRSTALKGRSWPRDLEDVDIQVLQLEQALESAGLIPAEQLPVLAPLIGLPLPAQYVPRPPGPDQTHRYLLGVLAKLLSGVARTEPAALVAEDLQWADPSSLELLGLIAEQGATAPLLLLLTVRPEFSQHLVTPVTSYTNCPESPESGRGANHAQAARGRSTAGNSQCGAGAKRRRCAVVYRRVDSCGTR
jgi:DNA-binding winged helix-turn-helix (wHTH) protein